MKVLEAKNIKKYYGKEPNITKALDGVDFSVEKGEFVAIVGTSGSGKSTLLNMLGGLDIPTSGEIKIQGKKLSDLNDEQLTIFRRRSIGFIFQNYSLLQSLTMYENIIAPLSLQKKKVIEMKKKAIELAKLLNIEHTLDKFPNECSGGEKQRAAIARALITNPKLIVADEPTGNLDSKNSHELLEMLKNMNTEESRTIIMVTHDSFVASYSKKVYYMKDGHLDLSIDRNTKSQDDYYKDQSHLSFEERVKTNYDHPFAFDNDLLVEQLKQLKEGKSISKPTYDYTQHTRSDVVETITPRDVYILEGLFVLYDEKIRDLCDILVFVDTDADIRFIRRLKRDIEERGRSIDSVCNQYLETVRPMHEQFVEPSKKYAHIIIPEGGNNTVAIDLLITKISSVIDAKE